MKPTTKIKWIAAGAVLLAGLTALAGTPGEDSWVPFDHPSIDYYNAPLDDPIARLDKQIQSGKVKLEFSEKGVGYLQSLLKALNVSVDSQVLVFSKTSFQSPKIGPRDPRAIFFNDDVAVGSVQTSDVLELAALDPRQGVVFYTLDNHKKEKPEFDRRDVCLQCHQGINTIGIPGILVSSVFPNGDGMPAFRGAAKGTDGRSRLEDRWGGWYVTGTHGDQRHMGNAVAHDPAAPTDLEAFGTQNLTSLDKKVNLNRPTYLAKTSDIVALMTLEHQTRMTNLLIRVGWEARIAAEAGKNPLDEESVKADLDDMVTYMLFADEAVLHDPVKGVSTYTETFQKRGPRDSKGRSLRDFDLETRLFKYPVSYMVYSEAFDRLPDVVREQVYRRVYDVLSGKDQSPKFAGLSAEKRQAALEILRETKKNIPAYFREGPVVANAGN
jgi:hypothetical protein